MSLVKASKNTPFLVSVWDLMHRPGEMRERLLELAVPEKLGEGLVAVSQGTVIQCELRLESLHEGVLVTAAVATQVSGTCCRCLIDINFPLRVEFVELFAYSLHEACDYLVHDDHVDLEPLIRDAVVLALPFQPVCRPDCLGLDPLTGEQLVDLPEHSEEKEFDPRWSALAGFLGENPSVTR